MVDVWTNAGGSGTWLDPNNWTEGVPGASTAISLTYIAGDNNETCSVEDADALAASITIHGGLATNPSMLLWIPSHSNLTVSGETLLTRENDGAANLTVSSDGFMETGTLVNKAASDYGVLIEDLGGMTVDNGGQNNGTIASNGNGYLSDTAGLFVNEASGVFNMDASQDNSLGHDGEAAFYDLTNDGTMSFTGQGKGTAAVHEEFQVADALINNGAIGITKDWVDIIAPTTGSGGTFNLNSGALTFDNTVAPGQMVNFGGPSAPISNLFLGDAETFKGIVSSFSTVNDAVVLQDFNFTGSTEVPAVLSSTSIGFEITNGSQTTDLVFTNEKSGIAASDFSFSANVNGNLMVKYAG